MRRLIIWGIVVLILCAITWAGAAQAGGSFTIEEGTDVKSAKIWSKATEKNYNYGAAIYLNIGNNYGEYRSLIWFETLADSMKQVVTDSGGVTWDSAVLTLTVANLTSEDDSVYVSLYKIIRDWEEGDGTTEGEDTCGVCWDSANAIDYTDCSGSQADWGTDGCDNTTTDRSATRETCSGRIDSILVEDADESGATKTFGISSATITDTLKYGLLLMPVAMTETTSPYGGFYSEDYGTALRRPKIQVWYTKVTGDGGARRRLMIKEN